MFSTLKRILGTITIKEINDNIVIEGVAGHFISQDIKKVWRTSKINEHMFTILTGSKIVIPKFFALEFVYILETLINTPRISQQTVRAAKQLIVELHKSTWLSNLDEPYPSILNKSRLSNLVLTPKPYQADFFDQYETNVFRLDLKGYLLAAPPGGGKTFTGIALMEQLEMDMIIVVTLKNTLSDPWEKTLSTLFKKPVKWWSTSKNKPPLGDEKYFVCHYEHLIKFLDYLPLFKNKKVGIILDESHNLNEINSTRTNAFLKLCIDFNASHILWMSGTPIKALGTEIIPFLRSVCPMFTLPIEERFKKVFGLNAQKALDIMSHRIGLLTYRIPKAEIVDGSPIYETIKVTIPNGKIFTLENIKQEMLDFMTERMNYYKKDMPQYVDTYQECLKQYRSSLRSATDIEQFEKYVATIKEIRKTLDLRYMGAEMKFCNEYELKYIIPFLPKALAVEFRDIRSIVKYVHLKVRGECLGRVLGRRRIECHVAMVEHCNLPEIIEASIKKTLIFTSFVEVVEKTKTYLVKEGFKPLEVYGETNKDIKSILTQYEKNVNIDPLIATYKSLSTGVPVTSANTVALLNAPFRPHEKEQAISRSFRLGQDTQVYVYEYFLDTGGEPNISTRSNDILEWAQSQIDAMMGTSTPSVGIESLDTMVTQVALNNVPQFDWEEIVESKHSDYIRPKSDSW
jgi:SNF2 family DNA or RNA helicase